MRHGSRSLLVLAGLFTSGWLVQAAQNAPAGASWTFVASGDARNCGDIVMPAIAETARANRVAFYWHLGDLRRTSGTDEDIQNQPPYLSMPPTIDE
jgi:hypothetical protein